MATVPGQEPEGYEAFLADLRSSGLLGGVGAEDAAQVVLGLFLHRISGGEAARLMAEFPYELQMLLGEVAPAQDAEAGRFGRDELVQSVARQLVVDPGPAEAIARAVFAATRVQLSDETAARVAHQLPADLREWWERPETPPLVSPEDLRDARLDEMVGEIIRALTCDEAFAWSALAEVLCALEHRLSGGEARLLAEELPWRLRQILRSCQPQAAEPPHPIGRKGFLEHLELRLDVDRGRAEQVAQAVFTAVRRNISPERARDVSAQLPSDLKALWWGRIRAAPPEEEKAREAEAAPEPMRLARALLYLSLGRVALRAAKALRRLALALSDRPR